MRNEEKRMRTATGREVRGRSRNSISITAVCAAVWIGLAALSLLPARAGEPEPVVESMEALLNHDGLLDRILTRLYQDGDLVIQRIPPFANENGGGGAGPDPDGIPYATVTRGTFTGPFFRAFFREGLNRAPDYCVTPFANPATRESRITVELWHPDPMDFTDLDSAVLLVLKSAPPNGVDPTPPQLMADQLVQWGISTAIWWERDDAPFDTTPHLDLIIANRNADNVTLMLGNGNAQLEPPLRTPYVEDSFPHAVAVGDFDADGNPDFVVAHDGADEVNVRLGDGFGFFKENTTYAVGQFPRAVATGQLDASTDSHVDIVVANRNSDNIHVLLGDGAGNFPTITPISVGDQPSGVVVGDFDEDGTMDLVVSNGGDNTIEFLAGNGTGGFTSSGTYATGANPFSIAVGDIDNDSYLDIATGNRDDDTVSILLGNGDGTFAAATSESVGSSPTQVVVANFGADGNLDIATSNSGSDNVTVLLGLGTGAFAPGVPYSAGSYPNALAYGDMDENGQPDLLVANRDSDDLTMLLCTAGGTFVEAPRSPFVVDDDPSGIVVANFTNSSLKMSHQFGYSGDGEIQKEGFDWIVHRRLNKAPSSSLTAQELRFDLRFMYAQAYLMTTTFFGEYMKNVFGPDPNVDAWVDELKINYAGGSKRGGGVTTAVLEASLLSAVDPRNIRGLFISGYQGLDASDKSGFHRYESDWKHTFDPAEVEEFRTNPCPVAPCMPGPCADNDCFEDSGEHPFKEFAIWAHRTRDEPQSYASAYMPGQNALNFALLNNVLVINAVGTHDWINPLGSHRGFLEENPSLDVITVQRINRNHGSTTDLGDWSATEIVQMRALYNMRWAGNISMIDQYPLHRIRWVDLVDGSPNWTATIELDSTHSGAFTEEYKVWVAFSDDRDFRRTSDPIESLNASPCIDSDPNAVDDDEDMFFEVTPISVVPSGNQRVITFDPPAEMAAFTDPLVAVIVEGYFEGSDAGDTLDDLLVTTWPEFVNEDLYPSSITDCQGQDGENVLTVNGSTGVGDENVVLVDSVGPMQFHIALPSGGGNGKFIANLDAGAPTEATITKLTNQLGNTCFPILLTDGAAPVARYNNIGKEDKIGGSEYFGDDTIPDPARAPTTFLDLPTGDPANLPIGTVFTLQGVILNPAVVGAKQASITNAIVVTVY